VGSYPKWTDDFGIQMTVILHTEPLKGRAIAQAVSRRPVTAFNPWSDHVGFVVDKVALGQVFP
jgi:hypothetical protein